MTHLKKHPHIGPPSHILFFCRPRSHIFMKWLLHKDSTERGDRKKIGGEGGRACTEAYKMCQICGTNCMAPSAK